MVPTIEVLEDRSVPTVTGIVTPLGSVYVGGQGDAPLVQIYQHGVLAAQWYIFPSSFHGGVQVKSEGTYLIFGAGPGGGPEVKVYDGFLRLISDFYTRPLTPGDTYGVTLSELSTAAESYAGGFHFLSIAEADAWFASHEIINYNETNLAYLDQAAASQSLVPQWIQAGLDAWGDKAIIIDGNSVLDYPPVAYLGSLSFPYAGGSISYRNAVGVSIQGAKGMDVVVINRNFSGAVNVFLHEQGHMTNALLGAGQLVSNRPDWQGIWQTTNWNVLFSGAPKNFYASVPMEAWAESFAWYLNSPADRANLPVVIQNYFHTLLGV